MNKTLFFILFLFACCIQANAQYNTVHNKVWAMGKKIGLDFRGGGDPIAIGTTLEGVDNEGCASVSDASGKFLFYMILSAAGNKLDIAGVPAGFFF